jgi:putative ABC transport system permease protein
MLQLRPILSTLRRHKTAALLIVLEIALTCAIVCNAVFVIDNRLERLRFDSGVAEGELLHLGVRSIGKGGNAEAQTRTDIAALRALPGVRDVSVTNQIPYGDQSQNSGINLTPEQHASTLTASTYSADTELLQTLGLRLVAGRNFTPDEVVDSAKAQASDASMTSVILTRATADRLFPDGQALGRTIYIFGNSPLRVVGVVERLVRPQPGKADVSDLYSALVPIRETFDGGSYLLRVDPARREAVLRAATEAIERVGPHRLIEDHGTLQDLRQGYYKSDAAMIWLLVGVCIALMVVTAFGIVGLASFWVQQRTKMIGTRRALGATRGQILRYFQAENLLLTTAGIVLGMLAAFGINQWLMTQYELPRLPFAYLPLGAIALWALGQLAVLAPARRAAGVPPAQAMRGLAG